MASLPDMGVQIRDWFLNLPPSRRIMSVGLIVAFALAVVVLTIRYREGNFELLYGGLTEEDKGAIIERLEQQNIEIKVKDTGIYVPRGMKYKMRAELAKEGLPYHGGGMGFEIFDKSQIGMTSYHQKVNFQRALRGELVRTINSLSIVKSSRVNIQQPEPSAFIEEEQEPTASVVLELAQGQRLDAKQVKGVAYLVASTVAGLTPENVKILNDRGELLSMQEGQRLVDETTQQLRHQVAYERKLKNDIEQMLERWFGRGRVVANVSARIDFSQTEEITEEFEEDNKVLVSQKAVSGASEGYSPSPGGAPGVASNRVDEEGATAGLSFSEQQASVFGPVTEFKSWKPGVTRKVYKTPVGQIRQLQVAVLVDSNYARDGSPQGEEGAPPAEKSAREIQEETRMVEAAVQKAIGYSEDREDQVEVSFVPFDRTMIPISGEAAEEIRLYDKVLFHLTRMALPAILGLIVVLFFFMVIRPFMRYMDQAQRATRQADAQIKTVAELEASLDQGVGEGGATAPGGEMTPDLLKRRERDALSNQIEAFTRSDPQRSAKMIKSWLES